MPCYTQSSATVQFGKNTDTEILRLALASLGISSASYAFNSATGELTTFRASKYDLAAIKRAYSEQVVIATAKKNGWQLQWSTNANGNRQAEVIRATR